MSEASDGGRTPKRLAFSQLATSVELVLGALFLWAAAAKSLSPDEAMRFVVSVLKVAPAIANWVIWLTIFGEIALGVWLISGVGGPMSSLTAMVVLGCFSGLILYAVTRGFTGGCGCVGIAMSARSALIRNSCLIGAALLAAAVRGSSKPKEAFP
ncbi:MAG: hypothetical protein KIT68_12930 [Phycisphaeraceae bacterium]|nr:hypothetical protein [Phycisphaeraceae bacterium]